MKRRLSQLRLVGLLIFVVVGVFGLSGCGTPASPVPDTTPSLFLDASFRYQVTGIPRADCVIPAGEYVPIAMDGEVVFYRFPKPMSINGRVNDVAYGIFLRPPAGKHEGWGVFFHDGDRFLKGADYEFDRPPFRLLKKKI